MGAYLGEIRLFALPFVPHNWLPCDGSLQPVLLYPTLGQLLGKQYGGDGATTFGVPDLRGRVPLCQGTDRWGNVYALGATGGAERVTLTGPQVPSHSHAVVAITQTGPYVSPIATYPAAAGPERTDAGDAGHLRIGRFADAPRAAVGRLFSRRCAAR